MRTRAGITRIALAVLIVAAVGAGAAAQTPRKTVMVVEFEDIVGGWSSTREVVTVRIVGKLRDEPALRVLPREQVQDALRAARLETAGILDREAAQQVAKGLQADYVLMGQVAAFDQQHQGGCVPIVGCVYTLTATVGLRGKVLDVAGGAFVADPKTDVKKQQTSASIWVGPWWTSISVSNFDGQLIGKATAEAVDDFVKQVKPSLR